MAYQINVGQFEGPFDLLLYLIQKNQIDIYDISISEITGQYLQVIHEWQETDLEIASEFIIMAARLMEIKSRMLIPGAQEEDNGATEKEELVAQLLEYQTYKTIASYFKGRESQTQGAVYKEPDYYPELEKNIEIELDPLVLSHTIERITAIYQDDHEYKKYPGEIKKDLFSEAQMVELILNRLESSRDHSLYFSELIKQGIRQEIIAAFQAMLTCFKTGKIRMKQMGLFGEIRLIKA